MTVNLSNPKNGDFIQRNIQVSAEITSENDISQIQLIFNNELMDNRVGLLGKNVNYQFNLVPRNILLQNSMKIRVVDKNKTETVKEVILYK